MDVDLLPAVPLDAVGDSPCALSAEERGKLDAEPRVGLALLRKAVVVVRLREVDERPVLLAALDGAREIPLEGSAVIGLEDFGIGPVEVGLREQAVGHLDVSAESLEHEYGVRILLADARDDVFPGLRGNHVARVAAEAVHSVAAPEQEDVRHVGPQLGIRVVELHEVRPLDAPRSGRHEASVRLAVEPVGMVGLQRRRPAGVVRGEVDEEESAPRVYRVDEFAELVERRRVLVELRHRGIDGKEIEGGERASVLAHHGVGGRDGERRESLYEPEAHLVHDERKPPHDLAEGPELAREDGVDRVVPARQGALDLYVQVLSLGPLRHVGALGEEAGLAGEDADLVERNVRAENSGRNLGERNVRPGARERRLAAFGLRDDFAAPDPRTADVRAECGPSPAGRVEFEGYNENIAPPL